MKKALLAVSFGVASPQAEEQCIRPIERALHNAFPEYALHRAYTSRKIIQKLNSRGIFVDDESQAVERLRRAGFDEILVVPTHMICGAEYARVKQAAGSLPVAGPLLESEGDIAWMAGLLHEIAQQEERPLVLMGHGTDETADTSYARLKTQLDKNIFLACLRGRHSLDAILPELEKLPEKKLTLMPLMITAGKHARDEMAGDEQSSWKSRLEAMGFDLEIRMQGMGALDPVQQRFVKKAKACIEMQCARG